MVASLGILLTLGACSTPASFVTPSTVSAVPDPVQVTFQAVLPDDNPNEEPHLLLEILDTVTGLAINPNRYLMEKMDDGRFSITIPFVAGSLIQYRYALEGTPPIIEHNSENSQIQFRVVYAKTAMVVNDSIHAWRTSPYEGKTGRLYGKILDSESKQPVGGIYVSIAGQSTLSSLNGEFVINNVPVGTHLVTFIHPDGRYEPLSQEARVADQAGTPANVSLLSRPMVKVDFVVAAPKNTPSEAPLRLIGNTVSLGNGYTELQGGMRIFPATAPVLKRSADGTYRTVLQLPAGADIRYKYSLGDGFWNAEHKDGNFYVRQLMVPDAPTTVNDQIQSWQILDSAEPIVFNITLPGEDALPPGIQLNPFAWMEPLPAWKSSSNSSNWEFILFSPVELLGNTQYRVCRASQCPAGLELLAEGKDSHGEFNPQKIGPKEIQIDIKEWLWNSIGDPVEFQDEVKQKESGFIRGIEFNLHHQTSWPPYMIESTERISDLSASTVVMTPAWEVSGKNLPVVEAVPGKTIWDADIRSMAEVVKSQDMQIWLYPQLDYPVKVGEWLGHVEDNGGWWQTWFDRVEDFSFHYARLAEEIDAETLIIGEPIYLAEQIPVEDEHIKLPADINQRWLTIIKNTKKLYSGKVLFALPYPLANKIPRELIEEVDGIYLLWGAPADSANLDESINKTINEELPAFLENYDKPVVLGISYSSQEGAENGCTNLDGICVFGEQPELNFEVQNNLFQAMFRSVDNSKLIGGVIVRGYYAPVAIPDVSPSINGKPAQGIVQYWFSKWKE